MPSFQNYITNNCFNSIFVKLIAILTLTLACQSPPAFAEDANVFVMAGTDGYGVTDCLREKGTCGQIVADAWCESHGFQKAIAFGLADDVTASIAKGESVARLEQSSILIRCTH